MLESQSPNTGTQDAGAKLDALTKDPQWGAKLISGDGAALREFHDLTQAKAGGAGASKLDNVLSGRVSASSAEVPIFEFTTGGELSTQNTVTVVEALKELGLSDAVIREAFNSPKVS